MFLKYCFFLCDIYLIIIKGDIMKQQSENMILDNPLSDLINDTTYTMLYNKGLINEKSVRDYQIKRKFREMRNEKISATNAIDQLRELYPYLQFDTIRKIVYQI